MNRITTALLALALAVSLALHFAPSGAELRPQHNLEQGIEPCYEEDGAGQKLCLWNAKWRGNGTGRSYVMFKGKKAFYIPQKAANKIDIRWERYHD